MKDQFFLYSRRLKFRPWTFEDKDLAKNLWGDAQVTQYIGGPFDESQIDERLEREINNYTKYAIQYWAVYLKESEEFIGCCGLRPYFEEDVLELGYHLCPRYWGKGYGSEAAQCVAEYAFETLKVRKLFAGHHPENSNSKKILLGLGFQYIRDQYYPPTGLEHPCYELTYDNFHR